jgi:hypothetical protein
MSDKTDAQIDREKQAVAAMTNAKSNMDAVLSRVATLERVLNNASSAIQKLKRTVGQDCQMMWHDGQADRRDFVTKFADEQLAEIVSILSK